MVPDPLLYGVVCLAAGLLGLVRPRGALVAFRVTRGRSPNPDARSTAGVRIVAGFLVIAGLVGVATGP